MLRGLTATLGIWAAGAIALRAVVVPPERCPPVDLPAAQAAVLASAGWMERAQEPNGTYLYEYDGDEDAELDGYNVVRHAGVTMSLYQLAAAGELSVLPVADRGLGWMLDNLYEHDDWSAFEDPNSGDLKLGATALMLAGLEQRRLATGDTQYDELMRRLARFMLELQLPDGAFLEIWLPSLGGPYTEQRSKYATGEAFWALTLMHEAFPGQGWDVPARKVADYLALHRDDVEQQKFPPWADQWAAYGLAEMADWGLSDDQLAYARRLAERFGFLVRAESQRTTSWWSELIHGRQARAAGMGTWVEGLASLWRVADIDPRMADMKADIETRAVCGMGMLADRQVDPAEAADYARPGVAEGAWFTKGVTRMDDQQHALSALLRGEAIFAARGKE
ncbi:MAG: hypothetical protein ACM3S1_09420 [Hyphomicrobiales bacterium]